MNYFRFLREKQERNKLKKEKRLKAQEERKLKEEEVKKLKGKKSIAKILTFVTQLIIAALLVAIIIYSIF